MMYYIFLQLFFTFSIKVDSIVLESMNIWIMDQPYLLLFSYSQNLLQNIRITDIKERGFIPFLKAVFIYVSCNIYNIYTYKQIYAVLR